MPQFAGRQIAEMADIRATRKSRLVLLCSIIAILILLSYGVLRLTTQDYFFASVNFFSATVLIVNLYYLFKHMRHNHCDVVLSGILLFQATLLLIYGEHVPDRILWLYPIVAVLIFANDFKTGAILSSGLCVVAVLAVLFAQASPYTTDASQGRFVVSLLALCVLCNVAAFYYSKVMKYVQDLYKEGIEDLAYLDQLTGLANRWSFESWAAGKLEEQKNSNKVTAMVFLDIDNFKAINDTYGHDVGDRVLQHLANRLKNNIRNKDRQTDRHDYSIARFAGDEFVLLLYDVNSIKDLEGILKRICHLFSDSYQASERINELTVSAGVALYPQDATNLPELTRCADKAMYAAKHKGKNQYRFYRGYDNALQNSGEHVGDSSKVTPIKKFNRSCT
ncbi:GGDEF domain-containing protein [Vibrio sinaloensis]|uniref:GGDEF domain-containing protein n=1 Tax=Photobacterium sp. (strain ATCC 43367) TaxID=379097 RepID=UPI0022AFDBF5|nr:GGDEF domain-containing protein [Vibrio sinaloensis]MCZ4293458.1 GGDEF domain-containing protein [Vibrio sinaloensis]